MSQDLLPSVAVLVNCLIVETSNKLKISMHITRQLMPDFIQLYTAEY
jgi:hypothetical protein